MSQNATTAMRMAPHTTPEERAALGKEARRRTPRSGHAVYKPSPDRPDPLSILEAQSASRVPELVPIRYGRMTESPFRFYRGAAAIMASDLAGTPVSGLTAQLCGDAHLLNFRLLASPERQLMFDINDFDETLPGPWEWDVKRLSASLVIAGRANGFDDAERAGIVSTTVRSYREAMIRFAETGNLDVWYAKVDQDLLESLAPGRLHKHGQKRLARAMAKARTRDSLQAFDKLTVTVDGRPRIAPDPPLLMPAADLLPDVERSALERQFRGLVERYGRTLASDRRTLLADYRLADVARKVVGVGSVGTRCWIFLLLGRDGQDPLFLQAKEADTSVLAEHVGASRYRNQGERVVSGQRLMQAASDIFLGWERVDGIDGKQRDFYVRQLRDWKGIAVPETMRPEGMRAFGQLCGFTLARAHARSGDRIAIASYLGKGSSFDRALATFAEAYADQNERDHQALVDAVRAGRLPSEELPAAA
ncbi:DUF2252 domain-containing protein [Streptomyces europaeiscabiei]|uniref:DUF2252 domain-containing protein n=1 Tax=Streptomyces europaeiscabiei TaxID=146819 RepID=A0ABU4NHW0_9ACTN|nr:DUF2252 domain-containing protein [Streptomyces europaeiscabiei]MDX2522775.1 DUF2252 domain-containing protein [Streptomyces europaeiscabiei]MDX2763702.1 DUF2252 domain-containing protein [Streptomyces europaeiscabiei]MDX3544412.1 DUF2252 domain-containing protein [Streptomyces europaeiscabiei]MDX3553761.1 DUF2252 domain-containing protein [Streptomyces europaeiscabiei]MDX3670037.1 DUF2252 domain-containing protein [Streptomyces europaeiscabiei]